MRVTAFLADSAVVADGRLFVLGGGWSSVQTREVPLALRRLAIGLIVSVPREENRSSHRLKVRLLNEEGEPTPLTVPDSALGGLESFNAILTVDPMASLAGSDHSFVLAIGLDNLIVEHVGHYTFEISINGVIEAVLPLDVRLLLDEPTAGKDDL